VGPTLVAVITLAGAALAGCAATPEAGGPVAGDTLRGTVRVVGADPATMVVLDTGDGRVTLRGEATAGLRRVNGLGVWVRGALRGGAVDVTAFQVREADGMPAADGVLQLDGEAAVLVTADGERLRYTPAPAALRARVGARVWIAGPVGGEPQAWGVIQGTE
jgi:hypothetical protein